MLEATKLAFFSHIVMGLIAEVAKRSLSLPQMFAPMPGAPGRLMGQSCFLSRSGVTSGSLVTAASFCVCEHDAEEEVEKLRPNNPEFCLHSSF